MYSRVFIPRDFCGQNFEKPKLMTEDLVFKRKSLFCIHTNEKIYTYNSILSFYISPEKELILNFDFAEWADLSSLCGLQT